MHSRVRTASHTAAWQEVSFLKRFQWASLTVDEGHRLKNSKSRLYQVLNELTTECRLLLSGTPLQNNLEELFMLMHFIEPDKFDDVADFQARSFCRCSMLCSCLRWALCCSVPI